MDYKDVLGIIATVIAFVGYVPYFRDIFAGRTKPHAFSWLVWGLLTAIAFLGQITNDAGPGAWVTGFTTVVAFLILVLAFKKGERQITLSDWISLLGALIAIIMWIATQTPLYSVILITIIDALGFYPTFRKSYFKPYEETLSTYLLSGLKFLVSIIALDNLNIITYLYPLSLVIMNWVFVAMLAIKRKQIER